MLAITSTWYVVESVLKSENARLWGSGLLNGRFNELLKRHSPVWHAFLLHVYIVSAVFQMLVVGRCCPPIRRLIFDY